MKGRADLRLSVADQAAGLGDAQGCKGAIRVVGEYGGDNLMAAQVAGGRRFDGFDNLGDAVVALSDCGYRLHRDQSQV
jgi:hypothetical protein